MHSNLPAMQREVVRITGSERRIIAYLRTGDALHLSCASHHRFSEVHSRKHVE